MANDSVFNEIIPDERIKDEQNGRYGTTVDVERCKTESCDVFKSGDEERKSVIDEIYTDEFLNESSVEVP